MKAGASVLEVAEKAEAFIKGRGMLPSFPVNLSVNERAAHYTPLAGDQSVFGGTDVVKIDLGARKGDALGDCAVTVDLSGNHSKLIDAAEEALEAALSKIRKGVALNSIGREVGEIAKRKGFNPIRNLGGHGIEKGDLHAAVFIPNFDNGDTTELEEGQVVAVEVFLTYGAGYVTDGDVLQIFRKSGEAAGARNEDTRRIASFIEGNYGTYPFALRWLAKEFDSEFKIRRALNELASLDALEPFPMLVEKTKGIVAQAEKEVIVEKDSCSVVTR